MSIRRTVVGLFSSLEQARRAIVEIGEDSLANNQVSLVIKKRSPAKEEYAAEIAGYPAPGTLDDFHGLLVQVQDINLDRIGSVEAGGPVAGAISQEDKGLAEVLGYYGMDFDRARYYEDQVATGMALVVIETNNDKVNQVANILLGYGGQQVEKWSKTLNHRLRAKQG